LTANAVPTSEGNFNERYASLMLSKRGNIFTEASVNALRSFVKYMHHLKVERLAKAVPKVAFKLPKNKNSCTREPGFLKHRENFPLAEMADICLLKVSERIRARH
jgi:hypothetical protein